MLYRHGDVLIAKTEETLPVGALRQPRPILAYGEVTGHSHRIAEPGAAVVYAHAGGLLLQVVAARATLVHEEHKPIELTQGLYRVWMQREYTHRLFGGWWTKMITLTAQEALPLLLAGKAPNNLTVEGTLAFGAQLQQERNVPHDPTRYPAAQQLTHLPRGLTVDSLDVRGCKNLKALPEDITIRTSLKADDSGLQQLPSGLTCDFVSVQRTPITVVPPLNVRFRLDLTGCVQLRELPENLTVGTLVVRGCQALEQLPEGISVFFLDATDCTALRGWPVMGRLRHGRLVLANCWALREIPAWVEIVSELDLRGCVGISALPETLTVTGWVDVADTQLTRLPPGARGAALRWKGVRIDERIAFNPESITATEVLAELNVERRRVLLERLGYERFLTEVDGEILDTDSDPGGRRQLMRVDMGRDEDLLCLSVLCPSTARQYVLRVPPTMTTCHQAAAWVAGFDDAALYKPVKET